MDAQTTDHDNCLVIITLLMLHSAYEWIFGGVFAFSFIFQEFDKYHKLDMAFNYIPHIFALTFTAFLSFSGIIPYCKRLE